MKKELLIPYQEYQNNDYPIPYTFSIEKEGRRLFYFGSKHFYDPEDPQKTALEECWNDFVKKTAGQKRIVLVEGGIRPILDNRETALIEGGEMGFISYLAKQENIDTYSPEPPAEYRYETLLQHFSEKEIAYYDFILVCYQWNRKKSGGFKEYVEQFLETDQKKSGWNDFSFTYENLVSIHQELFGTEFDEHDEDFIRNVLDPLSHKSVINAISLYEEEQLRDDYIVQEIERFWKEGNSIFVLYGMSHAVRQEPVIRDFVEHS